VDFDFATSWSLHPEEIVSLLYPSFVGYNDSYWGRNPFKLNAESPGPLILLLAIGGFILLLRRREMLPWLVLFIFCPIYALGAHTPLFKAIFYGVPGAKFLRAPSIIMFMFSCSASVLAAFFIDSRLNRKMNNSGRRLITGLIIFVVFATIVFTAGRGALLDVWRNFYTGMEGKAGAMALAGRALNIDALLLLVFGGLTLVLIHTAYARRWRGALWLGIISAGILVTSLSHSLRFIDYIGVGEFQRMDPMIEYISEDDDTFRTLPVTGSSFYNRNYLPLFGLETANGFYDNRIRYYDTLSGEGFQNLFHTNIMGITNIKYILTGQRVEHPGLALRRDFGQAFVYENRGFLPRAFLVHNAVVVPDDSAAVDIMMQPDFDPSGTIVLHSGEPLLFYSGNYLPYWKAYVDGGEVPVVRCDVAMRAVYLDPGDHTIEMRYVSRWYRTGAVVCLISCLFVGLSVLVGLKLGKGRSRRA
jgi:hypothetical protein